MKNGRFEDSKQLIEKVTTELYLEGSSEATEQMQKVEMLRKKVDEE